MTGIHVPACPSLSAHIDAAVAEVKGEDITLGDFVIDVQAQWAQEQQIADAGDLAVIEYWRAVEHDWMRQQGVSQ